jgi:predicted metallopeptidase
MRGPFRLPHSHRARVRLLRRTIVAVVALTLAFLIGFFRNTGHSLETPREDEPAVVIHEPKHVPATPEARRRAEETLSAFVRSAFLRRNLASSWPLATKHMKEGTTYREWRDGNLPVFPYPADAFDSAGWTLEYSYRGVLGYDVLIIPKRNKAGDAAGQQVYACELHDVRGRWLVDFCYPRKTL